MASGSDIPFVFRTDAERGMPPILREVLTDRGWEEYDESIPANEQAPFNLFWRTNRFTASEIQSAKYPCARINHYPKSSEITKKDHLYRHLRRMRVVHGSCYDYVPVTFALPSEYVKFCQFFAAERERWEGEQAERKQEAMSRERRRQKAIEAGLEPDPADTEPPSDPVRDLQPTYICKPSDLSRGRKIFVFRDIANLTYDCSSVVQRYIDRPLLIHGHKVDFRVYVLVTCFQPLRAYIFDDLLGRFSVEKYDLTNVENIFCHLTNYSINKNSKIFEDYKSGIGTGCKWHGAQLREYFAKYGIDWSVMWGRVEALVCYTLLSIAPMVPPMQQCFELYGFDIMFDQEFKPWLIEVNFSPALAVESEVDDIVKRALMSDMIDTLNIPPFNAGAKGTDAATTAEDVPDDTTAGGVEKAPSGAAKRSAATKSAPSKSSAGQGQTRGVSAASRLSRPTASKSASSTHNTAPTSSSSQQHPYIDAPKGKFRWCFPFSPETEQLSLQIKDQSASVDGVIRQCIAEVKKKEARHVQQMKDYADTYRAQTTPGGGANSSPAPAKRTKASTSSYESRSPPPQPAEEVPARSTSPPSAPAEDAPAPATTSRQTRPSLTSTSSFSAGQRSGVAPRSGSGSVAGGSSRGTAKVDSVTARLTARPVLLAKPKLEALPPEPTSLEQMFEAMRQEARRMAL